jgi:hypothetical protein
MGKTRHKGYVTQKNAIKRQYLSQMIKEVERLTAENKALKEDPTSVVGKFIGQFNDVVSQNQKLSTLACAIINLSGGKIQVTRDQIEVFKGKRLSIEIQTPDGSVENLDKATEYVFTFKATEVQNEQAPAPAELPPCTDPNCTLPKDLKHTHSAPLTPGETVPVPDAPNYEPQSGEVDIVSTRMQGVDY